MNKSKIKSIFLYAGSSLLAVLCILSIHLGWINNLIANTSPNIGAASAPVQMENSAKILNNALIAASEAVNPTIVSISVIAESKNSGRNSFGFEGFEEFEDFFGFSPFEGEGRGGDRKQRGGGSGVVITNDGYIVTNCHVVQDATEDGITVTTWDKKEYSAKLIGTDSLSDLAVIKIDANDLKVAHFGNADSLKPGMMVIAVGNPLGLNHTVTQGIISALGREQLGMRNSSYSIENYIQTDAAINPGNSGGGLFDLNGSLIGINTMIATPTGGFVGYGFAIPIDLVKVTAQDIIATGKVNRGYIGAAVANIDDKFAQHFGLDKVEGVIVQGLNPDSPAEKAGVKEEDIILEVSGRAVKTVAELRGAISRFRAGDEVTLTIWRDKKKITKKVILEAVDGEEVAENVKSGENNSDEDSSNETVTFEKLGFTIEPLTKDLETRFDIKNGVYVKDVKRFSPAAERNLGRNCVITKVDREDLKSTGQLKKIIESKNSGETILLNVKAQNSNHFMIVLEIP
jgi:serine protease Do